MERLPSRDSSEDAGYKHQDVVQTGAEVQLPQPVASDNGPDYGPIRVSAFGPDIHGNF